MLIKTLTDAFGLPGNEAEIRNVIKDLIKDYVDEMYTDRMGNLIAVKNKNAEGRHIAFSAHMDEVGLMVNHIEESGLIRFDSWGCDPRVLPAKVVKVGKNHIVGVIGAKAIHLQKPTEREIALKVEELFIDIGTASKAETEKLVNVGDYVGFVSEFVQFGEHKVKAKALDDRVGCAMLIEMLRLDVPYKITACFNAQEEVGTRGSSTSSKRISADLVVNVEGTVCADTAGVDEHQTVTIQGKGPAVSLIDKSSVYLKRNIEAIVGVAQRNNIPFQYRRTSMGGTDAGNYHTANAGTGVIGIAIPCRYIHSPVSVMDMRDYDNLQKLLTAFTHEFCTGKILL